MEVLKIFQEQLHYIPQTALVTILFFMCYLFISDNKNQIKTKIAGLLKQRWIAAFLCYSAFIVTITVLARFVSEPVYSGLGRFAIIENGKINRDAVINILLFIPYTFCYLKAFTPPKVFKSSFFLSLGSTVFIEVFQFLFWVGHFTIADIVHNTMGGIIGCTIFCIRQMIKDKRKKQSSQN